MLPRTIERFTEEKAASISCACALFGVSRQVYYRQKKSIDSSRTKATKVMEMVGNIRANMPRIGGRKLYYILQPHLKAMGVGWDKLFRILKANGGLITPVRAYHVTTNSHHRFRKYHNLTESVVPHRPEQIVASDITYIGVRGRHLYLSLVTDVYLAMTYRKVLTQQLS